jgi:hypothetical protein
MKPKSLSPNELSASDQVILLHWGLVHCVVCAPVSVNTEEVVRKTNELNPTGIDSKWTLSAEPLITKDEKHDWYRTNQLSCPDCATRTHYLLSC